MTELIEKGDLEGANASASSAVVQHCKVFSKNFPNNFLAYNFRQKEHIYRRFVLIHSLYVFKCLCILNDKLLDWQRTDLEMAF